MINIVNDMVLMLMRVFIVGLPACYFLNRGQNTLVRKIRVDIVVNHIEFAHI